jgi:hypothetical protein
MLMKLMRNPNYLPASEEARLIQDELLLRVRTWVESLPDFEAEPTDDARFLCKNL